MYSIFTLQAYLCWRHTYCQWPIIKLAKNVSKNKTAASHMVQFIRIRVFCGVKMADLSYSGTNRKCSSFATKHFRKKLLKIFDLHPPLRRLVSFVARIIMWKVRCWVTDTQTQTNPRCACAPRVNYSLEGNIMLRSLHAPTSTLSWQSKHWMN